MNETRLTLISDATQEFPNNTNVDFKICLAEPIHLKGEERWHAAMISLSTPNRAIGTAEERHVICLRHAPFESECPHVTSGTHNRFGTHSRVCGRRFWRIYGQCDRNGILVTHRVYLQAFSESRTLSISEVKQHSFPSLGRRDGDYGARPIARTCSSKGHGESSLPRRVWTQRGRGQVFWSHRNKSIGWL